MPDSLVDLEQQRSTLFQEMLQLPDFRSGSITPTPSLCKNQIFPSGDFVTMGG